MANTMYNSAKEAFISGDIDLTSDTIKVALVSSTYTYNSAHDFFDDVSGQIGTSETLGSKTVTDGTFDAADSTFSSVTAGSTVDAYIIYQDTGNTATSHLIAYFDTDSGGAISIPTNGGDITIAYSGSGIFSL